MFSRVYLALVLAMRFPLYTTSLQSRQRGSYYCLSYTFSSLSLSVPAAYTRHTLYLLSLLGGAFCSRVHGRGSQRWLPLEPRIVDDEHGGLGLGLGLGCPLPRVGGDDPADEPAHVP